MPRKSSNRHRITLDLPPEFVELCQADGIKPETVLRGFIADLASARAVIAGKRVSPARKA